MLVSDKAEMDGAGTQILHPGCRTLFRYWESLRAERPCPRREDIDLKAIGNIVPYLTITERVSGSKPWQFRLAGTKVGDLFGQDMTQKDVLAGFDAFERNVVGNCLDMSFSRLQPSLVKMRFVADPGHVLAAEMIALPILSTPLNRVRIFGGIFPFAHDKQPPAQTYRHRELVSARMIWTEHGVGDQLLQVAGRQVPAQLRVIEGGLR